MSHSQYSLYSDWTWAPIREYIGDYTNYQRDLMSTLNGLPSIPSIDSSSYDHMNRVPYMTPINISFGGIVNPL